MIKVDISNVWGQLSLPDLLATEKEIIYIVTKTEQKNPIMQAIMEQAGLDTKAKAIAFSLPVSDVAGLAAVQPAKEEQEV